MTTTRPDRSNPSAEAGPAGPAEPQRRPRARKGEGPRLRAEILAATERLLLQTGSASAVSIRAVADAVGVTPPSIYRHFADKETLLYEVCARHFTALMEHIQATVEGIDDPVEAVAARGRAYVRFGVANPEPYRIMFMTRPEGVMEMMEEWFEKAETFHDTQAAVQRCIDAGRFRPGITDAYRVTLGFWARVHGLTSIAISKPFLPIDELFVDDYVDVCLRGVVR